MPSSSCTIYGQMGGCKMRDFKPLCFISKLYKGYKVECFSGQFFSYFEITFFALLLLYLTLCTMKRLYNLQCHGYHIIFQKGFPDVC